MLATQCMVMKKSKTMQVLVEGKLGPGVTAKDITLAVIGKIGSGGGTGYAIEYAGEAIRDLSMEGRMTLCNMAIEAGARTGLVAVDEKTIAYLEGRPFAPKGKLWDEAVAYWRTLKSDEGAQFDKVVTLEAEEIQPQVTWGTNPQMVVAVDGKVPDPAQEKDPVQREWIERALKYMALEPNTPIKDIKLDKIFIGSCTNSRIEDLRAAAQVVKGKRVASNIKLAMVVPGLGARENAGRAGRPRQGVHRSRVRVARTGLLDVPRHERRSAFARRALRVHVEPQLRRPAGRRAAGRISCQPVMAAAAAIAGHFVDMREVA